MAAAIKAGRIFLFAHFMFAQIKMFYLYFVLENIAHFVWRLWLLKLCFIMEKDCTLNVKCTQTPTMHCRWWCHFLFKVNEWRLLLALMFLAWRKGSVCLAPTTLPQVCLKHKASSSFTLSWKLKSTFSSWSITRQSGMLYFILSSIFITLESVCVFMDIWVMLLCVCLCLCQFYGVQ